MDGHEVSETQHASQDLPRYHKLLALMEAQLTRPSVVSDGRGGVDLLATVGGWRGILEVMCPGLLFLITFIVGKNLLLALGASLALGAVFGILRLLQRDSLLRAVSGLIGTAICAVVANHSGDARDFYVPGFWVNVCSIVAITLSIAFAWPVTGIFFGLVRGEGLAWRRQPKRLRAYRRVAWVFVALFAFRLAVQVPLYYGGFLEALGAARLVMGIPLYALALWLAWVWSRQPVQCTPESDGMSERNAEDVVLKGGRPVIPEAPDSASL